MASFDAGFGTTAFSKKWLTKIPTAFLERQNQHFGVPVSGEGGMGGRNGNPMMRRMERLQF